MSFIPLALVALITWAIIKKRWGVLQWLGICVAPSLIVCFLLVTQLAFKGEEAILDLRDWPSYLRSGSKSEIQRINSFGISLYFRCSGVMLSTAFFRAGISGSTK